MSHARIEVEEQRVEVAMHSAINMSEQDPLFASSLWGLSPLRSKDEHDFV